MQPAAADAREFTLSDRDFARIVKLVKTHAGIQLGERKRELVYGRLARRLRLLGLTDFGRYCDLLEQDDADAERRVMINAITTNLTSFFREKHHFEFLSETVLPEITRDNPTRRLRIWSAGCSTGEEAYSIAMTVKQAMPDLAQWNARILATDIDTDVIATGTAGRYAASRVETVPPDLRRQFVHDRDDDTVEMTDSIKSLIAFKQLNLFDPWPMTGPFDVIFCRNVVIYFDKETQRSLFNRFADILTPDGWVFIGHSESMFQVCDRFRHMGRTIYRRLS
jgi:chemotaxis protein methyltransferase CheR